MKRISTDMLDSPNAISVEDGAEECKSPDVGSTCVFLSSHCPALRHTLCYLNGQNFTQLT